MEYKGNEFWEYDGFGQRSQGILGQFSGYPYVQIAVHETGGVA